MYAILRKYSFLLVVGLFCLGEVSKGYPSGIYGEFIDGEWVNRTIAQICSEYSSQLEEDSSGTTSIDLSTSTLLLGGAVIGLAVAAVPCIRKVSHDYIWTPTRSGYSKISRSIRGTKSLDIEEILPSFLEKSEKEDLIDLDQALMKQNWRKQPLYTMQNDRAYLIGYSYRERGLDFNPIKVEMKRIFYNEKEVEGYKLHKDVVSIGKKEKLPNNKFKGCKQRLDFNQEEDQKEFLEWVNESRNYNVEFLKSSVGNLSYKVNHEGKPNVSISIYKTKKSNYSYLNFIFLNQNEKKTGFLLSIVKPFDLEEGN